MSSVLVSCVLPFQDVKLPGPVAQYVSQTDPGRLDINSTPDIKVWLQLSKRRFILCVSSEEIVASSFTK